MIVSRMAMLAAAPALLAASLPLPESEIDALFESSGRSPGCAVAIVENGEIAFARGYGLADLDTGRPITPDTPFNIASMTKQFTAMAVAMLIEEGKLSEQDDVRRYLPELRDYGAPIRIAHLLNHSSGLRNHMALAAFQPGNHLPSHEEALALVYRQSALNFAPGTRHQYESPNYVLLAEVIARASGMRFEDFLEARILQPLGMAHSGLAVDGLARAYAGNAEMGFTLREKVNRARGSSGLLASASDFARWMINYDRWAVGGAAAKSRMLSGSALADGTPLSYRYGLMKQRDFGGVPGLLRIGHGGQTAAYRSAFSYFPGHGFGSVVLCNHLADANGAEAKISEAWVRERFPTAATDATHEKSVPLPGDLVERLTGTYYSAEDDLVREFSLKDGALNLVYFGQAFPLTHRGDGRFGVLDEGEFRFASGPDGVAMVEDIDDQANLRFVRLEPPPAQPLADYAGRYRSADVDGEVEVRVDGAKLVLRYPAGEGTLRPIASDRFSAPESDLQHVAFTRNSAGRVDGLGITTMSGISRLRFEREAG